MSTMESVRYRVANDRFEPNTYYVDTGFMYLEQDLQTGQVRDVTSSYNQGQPSLEYTENKPLAITSGSRPSSVILAKNGPENMEGTLRKSVVVNSKEGSVIMPARAREGSVIIPAREGSVIMPAREGSVIIKSRGGGSVLNGPVVRANVPGERIIKRTVTAPVQKLTLPPRHSFVQGPRYVMANRPQTARVVRPEGRQVVYRSVADDSVIGGYPTRRVIVRNREDLPPPNPHKLYKTTINVDTDSSSDTPRELVKTRYISSPSNQFKDVKGVPSAKMYVPTAKPSKNSNDDSDSSSLDSVDIKKFEKHLIKGNRPHNRK